MWRNAISAIVLFTLQSYFAIFVTAVVDVADIEMCWCVMHITDYLGPYFCSPSQFRVLLCDIWNTTRFPEAYMSYL